MEAGYSSKYPGSIKAPENTPCRTCNRLADYYYTERCDLRNCDVCGKRNIICCVVERGEHVQGCWPRFYELEQFFFQPMWRSLKREEQPLWDEVGSAWDEADGEIRRPTKRRRLVQDVIAEPSEAEEAADGATTLPHAAWEMRNFND